MHTKIDWLSFTFATDNNADWGRGDGWRVIQDAMQWLPRRFADMVDVGSDHRPGAGRAPYKSSYFIPSLHMTFFHSFALDHALCEVSGQGCEMLTQMGLITPLIMIVKERVTRLDIACDMRTAARPKDFIDQREGTKFISHAEFISKTGETCYLGSMKSERFCRVYRYDPPHPRADLLRAEHVFRKKAARVAVASLLADGIDQLAAECGAVYGWRHEAWAADGVDVTSLASGQMHRPGKKSTLAWLYGAVTQAIIKMVRNDALDFEEYVEWIRTNVRTIDKPPEKWDNGAPFDLNDFPSEEDK